MGPASTSTSRLLCVFAVLFGLIGMHGLGMGQDEGCHGGVGQVSMATSMATSSMATMPAARVAGTRLAAAELGNRADAGMGAGCVFVQPAGWPLIASALLAIISVAAGFWATPRRRVHTGAGRSPPSSGVSLLRQVCVSLT